MTKVLIFFSFTDAKLYVQHGYWNSHLLKSSGHSLVQSSHVGIAHSCSQWSCHCTDMCDWRTSAATFPCRHALCRGTGVRGGDCLRRCSRTDLSLCWHHIRHLLPRTGMGNTGHFVAPGGWHTPGETGPKSGCHIAPSGGPLSTCLMERAGEMRLDMVEAKWVCMLGIVLLLFFYIMNSLFCFRVVRAYPWICRQVEEVLHTFQIQTSI